MRPARGLFARTWFAAWLALAAACRNVEVRPADLERQPSAEREHALRDWKTSVELANQFLASSYRRTLPAGRFELGPRGMRFVRQDDSLPIEVHSTTWGDWVVRTGFAAQEREKGFVVGAEPPDRDALVDHSFFRDGDGAWLSPRTIAELFLHETTHVLYREGTVGFWNGTAYYLEAIFLFRYSNHSAERHANATSEEFAVFYAEGEAQAEYKSIYRQQFEQHLAQGPTDHCTHGSGKQDPRKRE